MMFTQCRMKDCNRSATFHFNRFGKNSRVLMQLTVLIPSQLASERRLVIERKLEIHDVSTGTGITESV
jgi:hypothetical protein